MRTKIRATGGMILLMMSFMMLSGNSSGQVLLTNEEAREIIRRLEKLDSLEGSASEIIQDLKHKDEKVNQLITTGHVSEWAYKTLESNYDRMKKAYNRLRQGSHVWEDIRNGLIGAGLATIIFLLIK